MKNKKKILAVCLSLLFISGCGINKTDSLNLTYDFKEEYESLNGSRNSDGSLYREIKIPEENPYVVTDAKNIVDKINKKESFVVYFGFPECPWCRSMVEKMTEIANKNKIETIYVVDISTIRDILEYNKTNNTFSNVAIGTDDYFELLDKLDDVLEEYVIEYQNEENETETKKTGEKRIYAPSIIYIENGKAKNMIDGISDKQEREDQILTDEIIKDMEEEMNDFFSGVKIEKIQSCSNEAKC